jgi:hypothetical protein
MAKKKFESSEKQAAPKKKASKKEQQGNSQGPAGIPGIDTDLAASSVARMLAAKAKFGIKELPAGSEGRDSGSFKHLKESMEHKHTHVAAQSINAAMGDNITNLPRTKNQAQSQTTGNVSRINVPRRTVG